MSPTRSSFGRTLLALLLTPWLAHTAQAEVLHVPAQFAQLQDAIAAAAPGDVILIQGGTHEDVVIDKPLHLAGHATARPLFTPLEWDGSLPFDTTPAVTLAGPGQGAVTLSAIDFGGSTGSVFATQNTPAIEGGGFAELRLLHCDIQAPTWVDPPLLTLGLDAAQVGALVDDLGSALTSSGPAVNGSTWSLTFEADDSFLVVSPALDQPQPLSVGLLFMDPTLLRLIPVAGSGRVRFDVGVVAGHGSVGLPIAVQAYSATLGLSRPVFASILLP